MRKLFCWFFNFITMSRPKIRKAYNYMLLSLVRVFKSSEPKLLMFGASLIIILYCGTGLLIAAFPSLETDSFFAKLSILAVLIYTLFKVLSPKQDGIKNIDRQANLLIVVFIVTYILLYCFIDQIRGRGKILFAIGNSCTIIGLIVVFVEIFFEERTLHRSQKTKA